MVMVPRVASEEVSVHPILHEGLLEFGYCMRSWYSVLNIKVIKL